MADIGADMWAYELMVTDNMHDTEFTVYEPFQTPGKLQQYRFADRSDKTSVWIEFDSADMDYG